MSTTVKRRRSKTDHEACACTDNEYGTMVPYAALFVNAPMTSTAHEKIGNAETENGHERVEEVTTHGGATLGTALCPVCGKWSIGAEVVLAPLCCVRSISQSSIAHNSIAAYLAGEEREQRFGCVQLDCSGYRG